MYRTLAIFISLPLLLLGYWLFFTSQQDNQDLSSDPYVIGVTQIVSHPALDSVRASMIKQLASRGYREGENLNIIFRNANGDQNLTTQIAQDFVAQKVDVIVPITTPSALAAAAITDSIPMVFAGVSYPVDVGLVENLEKPGGLITGTSDQWPFEEQLRIYLDIVPETETIGMLYAPGDDVSQRGVTAARAFAAANNLTLVTKTVTQDSDVYPAAVQVLQEVDVLYTGIDLLVIENFSSVLKAATEQAKPVLGGDASAVKTGAVMALSVSMETLGTLTGDTVADVLDGVPPGDISIQTVSDGDLYINRAVAESFGIAVETVIQRYPGAQLFPTR